MRAWQTSRAFPNFESSTSAGLESTGAGLKSLRGLTHLWSLNLGATRVGDSGLVHLRELTHLQHLGLSETNVTDAGLEHLKGLANLQALDISKTGVTASGLHAIRRALPEAMIIEKPESP